MLTVSLEGMRFYGFPGIYAEEKITGNELLADVFLSFEEQENIHDLAHTVDYEIVHAIIKKETSLPRDLLEELVQNALSALKKEFPFVKRIEIRMKKLHPPLTGETACSCVTLSKEFQ